MVLLESDPLMNDPAQHRVTKLLEEARLSPSESERKAAVNELFDVVYKEFHGMAARRMRTEHADHILQPTALVNETYLRLFGKETPTITDRKHFFAVAAAAMQHVLIDLGRSGRREKRGGDQIRVPLEDCMRSSEDEPNHHLDVQRGIEKLAEIDPRAARALDLHLFGLKPAEIAPLLNVSSRAIERDLVSARLFLKRFLRSHEHHA
jgi:RNA polymerase sigma-70 factor (ECF subfamily)